MNFIFIIVLAAILFSQIIDCIMYNKKRKNYKMKVFFYCFERETITLTTCIIKKYYLLYSNKKPTSPY